MATVTAEMTKGAYPILQDVWHRKIGRIEGMQRIQQSTGMNQNTAGRLIDIFLHMMDGAGFASTFNNFTFEFLLKSIKNDYGVEYFHKALNATKAHIVYYEGKCSVHRTALRKVIADLENQLK